MNNPGLAEVRKIVRLAMYMVTPKGTYRITSKGTGTFTVEMYDGKYRTFGYEDIDMKANYFEDPACRRVL